MRAPRTLTARLVITAVALVAVVSVLIAAVTTVAIRSQLLDNLDAKIHTFTREIRDDPCRETTWTAFNQNLGRRLFKGTALTDLAPA